MAKKVKASTKASGAGSAASTAPASKRPRRPLQLSLPRYVSLIFLQLLLVPVILFTLVRQLQGTGRPPTWAAYLEPLVEDPLTTLAVACAGLLLLQLHVGRQISVFRREDERAARPEDKWKAGPNTFLRGIDAVVTLAGASVVMHAIVFFLGAPLFKNAASTYVFALFMTLLGIGPAAFVLDRKADLPTWIRLFSSGQCQGQIDFALLYPFYGALLGAWLGAAPLALDWDRPWQRWPVPPVLGAWLGHAGGTLASLALCIALAVEEEGRKLE